ncbi:MAG: carboxypeptidase-like regulatory domain-containing protein [Bacteroidetes bacterium]|nr:MAG: carboxypeptidase-like regulatory domain-containing protein [Bacteroidota bacterium]
MYMVRFLSLLFVWACLPFAVQAGKLQGKITDDKGEGLPFATVYAKESGLGATANEQGEYSLKLSAGKHLLVFQYIGFRIKQVEVTMTDEDVLLDISLDSETLTLPAVELSVQDRDPAYAIIRQAQAKRKYYLKEEIKSYQTRAYIKSLQRLNKRPNAIMGQSVRIDTGVVYFSESLSEVSFKQPDKYFEKLLSSKVSGNSQAFSFNQASDAWLNLYENITGEQLTERGVVSPIASNALAYYRYRLIGAFYQDGQLINKIQLLPKRPSTPAYGGYLNIIEGSWRIHSAELTMRKGQVEFVDSASVYQVYAPVKGTEVWFPLTQKAYFAFNAFGFKGNGDMIFVFSPPVLEPAFPKKHFKQEVFVVEKEANKRDTTHWNAIRPIPLTPTEMRDYKMKDSIAIVKETKVYKDSVDKKLNTFRPLNLFWRGYTFRNSYRKLTFSFAPLPAMAQYNTVEGLVLELSPTIRKGYGKDNRKFFRILPTLRYGFANQRLQAKIEALYYFQPKKWQYVSMAGGQYVEQLARQPFIPPFPNTAYSLLTEQNFLKIYEKTFLQVGYGHRIVKGLRINASAEWNERRPLQNNSSYKWIDVKNRDFTANAPENVELASTAFEKHQALIVGAVLTINVGEKYAVYPEYTYTLESKYPTIRLNYRKGLAWAGSDVRYDFLFLQLNDTWSFGMVGESEWEVEVGKFLNSEKMQFIDYRHFWGNRTLFGRQDIRQYHLLDYYGYSTREQYLKAHYEHHFNGFFLNGIPLIRRLKWQEVVGVNFLHTPTVGQYWELGIGIEHIFKVLRVDWVTAFQSEKRVSTGFRLGFGF